MGVKIEQTRARRKKQPYKKNKWNIHLDAFRKKHKGMPFGDCLVQAKATYKYQTK